MNPKNISPGIQRPRYELLDGLRGVAAVLVIWYHFFEGFATSPTDQMLNHGYLAVDFFFVLSGFVIGYAYDGRLNKGMSGWNFMLRRLIRLHPMVILSVILGAIAYVLQGCVKWDGTPVSFSFVVLALLLGLLMIPVMPGAGVEVRGNGEMFPLNGPAWSLFFEYIGSILYAVVLHRMNKKQLFFTVIASALGLGSCALGNMSGAYHLGVGWSMADGGFIGGFFRLSFSFGAGLLLQRYFKPRVIRGAFWICTFIITLILVCPYIGDTEPSVWNATYDLICTLIVFPTIVYIGACGNTTDSMSTSTCNFLGQISYPLYIVHYPIMYMFYAWVWANGFTFSEIWPVTCGLFAGIILLAWASLKFYDEPVRHYLSRRWLKKA